MNIFGFIKSEFENFTKAEIVFFALVIIATILISLLINDSKIALISAICGISYTILAGKGKISCYFIGIIGTFCYSYIAYKNAFFGNLALYLFYYFPMEVVGIFKWAKNLKKDRQEIVKTRLTNLQRVLYLSFTILITILLYVFLYKINGQPKPSV